LTPKWKGSFLKVVKFAVCKSELNLMLILWISEFESYESLILATNNKRENYIVILMVEFLDSWVNTKWSHRNSYTGVTT